MSPFTYAPKLSSLFRQHQSCKVISWNKDLKKVGKPTSADRVQKALLESVSAKIFVLLTSSNSVSPPNLSFSLLTCGYSRLVHGCSAVSVVSASCDPVDYSPPGSSVHGILQARALEWFVMPSSRGSSDPGIEPVSPASPALQVDSLLLSHQGSPFTTSVQFSSVAQSLSRDRLFAIP